MRLLRPFAVVTPTLDGAVLQALLTVEHLETGAEIHRRAGIGSAHGVRKVLHRLVEQGIVEMIDYGNAQHYRLNRRHAAYDAVVALGGVRSVIADRIRVRIDALEFLGLAHAGLLPFTGDEVELLLIASRQEDLDHPLWTYSLRELRDSIWTWTGNTTRFRQLTRAGVDAMVDENGASVLEWQRQNTFLCGTEIGALWSGR